ncbi:uncharacterized protein ASCRUDRAFT_68965 [Ascoidea rubescens DSM 1968]|uniref:Uncharacterized protein n=1 Tax=Ascoidea rubescens DSM 1968 TaxID=1344418 RepID=A0A1D2VNM9_9ASCO|nr:hypothetical protein ASCRUDRAFT_68965 [Ascoidea rubescens DSM 1968]ODV63206.1 hypothetical protein ASCRUDRAFT_68965 [Ascoidea rubescens DSM 1968]
MNLNFNDARTNNRNDSDLINWENTKNQIKILFKQEVINMNSEFTSNELSQIFGHHNNRSKKFIMSYLVFKFPQRIRIKNQLFFFIQSNFKVNDKKKAIVLTKTTLREFNVSFLKWTAKNLTIDKDNSNSRKKEKMIKTYQLKPFEIDSKFLKSLLNDILDYNFIHLYNQNSQNNNQLYEKFGNLDIVYKTPTISNALNNITIQISQKDLKVFVDNYRQISKKKNDLNILESIYSHLNFYTSISFSKLNIIKLSNNYFTILNHPSTSSSNSNSTKNNKTIDSTDTLISFEALCRIRFKNTFPLSSQEAAEVEEAEAAKTSISVFKILFAIYAGST